MSSPDRRAVREGKMPLVESPSPSSEEGGAISPSKRRPPGPIFIGQRPVTTQPRLQVPVPPPPAPPAPPSVAGPDPAGPAGVASTMTPEDVEAVRLRYRVPEFIRLSAPRPEDRVTSVRPGRVALYEEFLRCGLRLPIHPFVSDLLEWYKLVPAQLTPNSIRIICCFVVLYVFHGAAARGSLFRALYKLRHHAETGWYIFASRPGRALPLRLPSKVKGWKPRFFYADVGGMRAGWSEPDSGPSKDPPVGKKDRDLFDRLMSAEIPSYKELLKEENLVEAELAPAMAMKIDAEALREEMRKRRLEAGETLQPARRVRRRLQRGPAPSSEGSGPSSAVVPARAAEVQGQAAEGAQAAEAARAAEGAQTAEAAGAAGGAQDTEAAGAAEVATQAAEVVGVQRTAGASGERPATEVHQAAEVQQALVVIDLDSPVGGEAPEAGMSEGPPAERRPEGEEPAEAPPADPTCEQVGPGSGPVVGGEEETAVGEAIDEGRSEETADLPMAEGAADEPSGGERREPSPVAPASEESHRRAVRKAKEAEGTRDSFGCPPRPAPRYKSMEDARRADVLLQSVQLDEFLKELRQQTMSGLMDGVLASLLQLVNGVLAFRDGYCKSTDAQAQTLARVRRLDARCRELSAEAAERSAAAGRERAALEADRDVWRGRSEAAEGRLDLEVAAFRTAEARATVASVELERARRRVEELSGQLAKAEEAVGLAEARVSAAEERAETAWSQIHAAGERAAEAVTRAEVAEMRANQSEAREKQLDELNKELDRALGDRTERIALAEEEVKKVVARAEEEIAKANAAQLLAAAQVWDAEARFEEAESRAWRAEAEARAAAEQARGAVEEFLHSSAMQREVMEAAGDAYDKGFNDCKARLTLAFGLDDTESIRPGDQDIPETPGPTADEEEAGGADGDEAAEIPPP